MKFENKRRSWSSGRNHGVITTGIHVDVITLLSHCVQGTPSVLRLNPITSRGDITDNVRITIPIEDVPTFIDEIKNVYLDYKASENQQSNTSEEQEQSSKAEVS